MRTKDESTTVIYPLRIPKPLYAKIAAAAKRERTTKVWQILDAIYRRFDRNHHKRAK